MPASEGSDLRVRMYNIGFGDCFLFYIPDEHRTRLLLLDFGRHLSSSQGNAVSKVGKDLLREAKAHQGGQPYFDVVVATHRHFDHIAGFDLSTAKDFEAGEIWLPWVDDPDDPEARDIQNRQFEFARALDASTGLSDAARALVSNSNPDFSAFQLSNQGAMDNLQRGLANEAPRRYLPERDRRNATFTTDHLPGVTVHAVGPSHDPDIISLLKPPKGEYYELVAGTAGAERPTTPLFRTEYTITQPELEQRYRHLYEGAALAELRQRATVDTGMAAQRLEDMVNGTSLVLVLEIGDAVIVLGGDAEWGTWSVILEDEEWSYLLANTTLYKVSHHGSYNGTPRRYVEDLMPESAVSLVSLCPMERWPSIPRKSLLAGLEEGDRQLVRTDRPESGGVVTEQTDLYTDVTIPIT